MYKVYKADVKTPIGNSPPVVALDRTSKIPKVMDLI